MLTNKTGQASFLGVNLQTMEVILKKNYFILAGTSGTGKTSVLNCLLSLGYNCVEEAARSVLREQIAADGPALPSKDPLLFIHNMMAKSEKDYRAFLLSQEPCFFDRGMPDLVHYSLRFNVDPSDFRNASQKYRYNNKVFLFPPWEEIFINDNERRMSFEKSVEYHELLVQVYRDNNYDLIDVPCLAVEARAEFILTNAQF